MNLDLTEFIQEVICLKNKGWGYIINLDKCADVGARWIALYCKNDKIVYFDTFLKKFKNLLVIKT